MNNNGYIFSYSEICPSSKLLDRGYVTQLSYSSNTDNRFVKIDIEITLDSNELSRIDFDGLRNAGMIDIYKSEKE